MNGMTQGLGWLGGCGHVTQKENKKKKKKERERKKERRKEIKKYR